MSNIQRAMNSIAGPATVRPPMMAAQVSGITPKEVAGILRRHIWLIISLTFMGLVIGGASWFLVLRYAPKYTAVAAIEVLPPGVDNPKNPESPTTSKDIYYQHKVTKAAYIKQQDMLQRLLQRDKIRASSWFSEFGGSNTADQVKDAVKNLENNLGVNPQRDSNWITVSMTCGSKKESALIVNEMVTLFLQRQDEDAKRDTGLQLAERRRELALLQQELLSYDSSLDKIREGTQFANLGKKSFRDYLDEKLEEIEKNRNRLDTEVSELKGTIAILNRRAQEEYDEIVRERIERDPIASGMRQRVAILDTNLASQLARFGEDHRRVRELRDSIKQARADLASRQLEIGNIQRVAELRFAQDQLITLQAQVETVENQRIQAMQEYKSLSELRVQYGKVVTKRDETQKALEEMGEVVRTQEAIYNDPELSKVRSIGDAPEPLVVSSPKILVYVPGGFMLGLMAGIGLAFAIELLNDILRTPSDVMKHLRVPLLAMISHTEEDELEGVDLYNVVRQSPYSIMSECYRQLRTNLRLSATGVSHKTLFITSCGSGCGKTSVSTNLTSTLVAEGKRVLLIDTNFRRPCITTVFPKTEMTGPADSGLSNYLLGHCSIDEVIRPGGIEGLDVIDTGPLPKSPAELLSNSRMSDLLSRAEQQYDHVIIDGPPLIVSDAKVLASQADGTVVVFNAMKTRKGEAQRALRELRDIHAEVTGTVLLGVRAMKGGYFQEIYKSYLQYQQVQLAAPV